MFNSAHLLHGREICSDTFGHDQSIHYMAHMEELNDAIAALLNGEEFEFSFDLTEFDRRYIGEQIKSVLGPDFLLDFH